MGTFLIGLAISGALVAVAAAAKGGTASPPATLDKPPSRGLAELVAMARHAGIPEPWVEFLAFVAWGESNWHSTAHNGSTGERAASVKSFKNNKERFDHCAASAASYGFGSGGWFGFLPAVGLAQFDGKLRCLGPEAVFDPAASLAMAVGFARGLMGWKGYKSNPSWLTLRVGWGWPAKMGDRAYVDSRRAKYIKHAAKLGLSPGWLNQVPPPLPVTPAQVYERLKG